MMKKRDLRFLSKMIYFCGSDHILNLLDDKDKENRIKEYNNYKKIKDKGLKLSLTRSGLFSLGVFILTIISSFGIFTSFLALAISFFITYSLAEEFYKLNIPEDKKLSGSLFEEDRILSLSEKYGKEEITTNIKNLVLDQYGKVLKNEEKLNRQMWASNNIEKFKQENSIILNESGYLKIESSSFKFNEDDYLKYQAEKLKKVKYKKVKVKNYNDEETLNN